MNSGRTFANHRLGLLALLALAPGCYNADDYIVTPDRADEILSVSSADGRTSLPADGFSHLTLVIRISNKATSDRRTVVVTTSKGKLIGGDAPDSGDDAEKVRKVVPDATGQGYLELVSSNDFIGAVTITAQVENVPGLASRTMTVQFTPPDPSDVIWFTESPTSAPADDATLTTFAVQISNSLPVTSEVTFSVSADDLSPSDLTPAVTGYGASLTIKSPPEARSGVRVTASVNSVGVETFIDFVPALPDALSLDASEVEITPGGSPDSSVLTATFSRTVGKVTTGVVVKFEVREKGGKLVFSDSVTWDGATNPSTTFTPTAATAKGNATAKAFVSGSSATASVTINVL